MLCDAMRICDWKSVGCLSSADDSEDTDALKEVTRLCRLGLPSVTIGEYGVWNILTSEVVKLEQVETHLCSRRSYNQLFYLRQTAYRWLTQSNFPLCGVNFVHQRKDLQVEHDGIGAERIQATEEFFVQKKTLLWIHGFWTFWDAFHLYPVAQSLFHYFAEDTKSLEKRVS